jgi:hypothetical protein
MQRLLGRGGMHALFERGQRGWVDFVQMTGASLVPNHRPGDAAAPTDPATNRCRPCSGTSSRGNVVALRSSSWPQRCLQSAVGLRLWASVVSQGGRA